MLTILRRWLAKARKTEPPPAADPDDAPIPFEQTRSAKYWAQRDARFRKPGEDRDGFAPRGWPL